MYLSNCVEKKIKKFHNHKVSHTLVDYRKEVWTFYCAKCKHKNQTQSIISEQLKKIVSATATELDRRRRSDLFDASFDLTHK